MKTLTKKRNRALGRLADVRVTGTVSVVLRSTRPRPVRALAGHMQFDSSTASRAFAFAIAAYNAPRVPPRNLRQARFGGARVIYLDAPEAAPASYDATLQAGYMPLAFIDAPDTGTQAELWVSCDEGEGREQKRVLAFRGTDFDRVQDLFTDLFVRQRQLPSAATFATCPAVAPYAHAGFFRAWLSVRDATHALLEETGDGALLITGHSLGGALAMLAARDLGPALASKVKSRRPPQHTRLLM